MIRKNEIAVINVYLNGHQIDKVYSGQIQVFPDQQIENSFWLKVTKEDTSVVYCWCRQTAKIEDSQGNITELIYEVIQTQDEDPGEDYYVLANLIDIQKSSNGYDDVETTDGLDPAQVYAMIPEIRQIINLDEKTINPYYKGINIISKTPIPLGITLDDYDRFEVTMACNNYSGDAIFGCNATNDNMDFRIFGYSSSNYCFDCAAKRLQVSFYVSSQANRIFTTYMVSGGTSYIEQTINGSTTRINMGTINFSSFTNQDKNLYLLPSITWSGSTTDNFVIFRLSCYNNNILLHDFMLYPGDQNLSQTNRLYDNVTGEFISLGTSFNVVQNSYYDGSTIQITETCKGNELNDFSLSETTYRELLNRVQYDYKNVLVTDPVSDKVYETGGKYVTESVEMTDNPTIYYTDSTQRLQAYGNGEVKLYFMNTGNQVSNPYTVTRPMYNTNYNVYATAQEEGKLISDTISQTISVSGYKTATPTITYNSNTFVVSASGNGTVLLYVDGVQVSNPYTLYQELTDTTYTVTATAQESGKEISYTRTQTCTVPAYQATPPTISFVNYLGQVSASGNGTVILYIDGIQVTNPYTLPAYGTYTATATSQETGRPISDTATKQIEYSESSFVATEYFWLEALEDNSVLAFNGTSELYYSTDKSTWTSFNTSITVNSGDRYYFKGSKSRFGNSSGTGTDTSNYFNLQTGKFKAGGNIMSMLYNDNFSTVNSVDSNQLRAVFRNCKALVEAPELPFTNLNNYCYTHMFNSCSNLTKAPEILPATTLYTRCYQWMFVGCTSLTIAPVLPATNIHSNCYNDMFNGCTSLNWIKNMTLVQPSTSNSWNMMYNVSQQGTFVKNVNATWTTKNEHGCPSKWTIEYAEN